MHHRVSVMSQGDSPAISPFTSWKPQDSLAKEAAQEKQDKWETVEERLEVKDAKFEENQAEVAQLEMNPHQIRRSRVNPYHVWGRRHF